MSLAVGSRVGVYEVLGKLGAGGMGEVYRATDTTLGRQVALKILPEAFAADAERVARFEREAKTLASLNHPHIAAIYGFEKSTGTLALAMELVEGEDLSQRVARGALPVDDALAIATQVAEALEAAHEQGIIHRDLKPANIKVRQDGTVKVLDFGLAKALGPDSGQQAVGSAPLSQAPTITTPALMTGAGMILGTAAYMAPEQAKGRAVDKRADIWAFGCVFYEMVTGTRAFPGDDLTEVLAGVIRDQPSLEAVPTQVQVLLARCLEKDPRKRLRDIGDAMSLAQAPFVPARETQPNQRWSVMAGWVAAALLALALIATVWWTSGSSGVGADGVAASPAVRFQLERAAVGPYGDRASSFAVSPDGQFLAYYVPGADGRPVLSLRTLATGEAFEVPGSAILAPAAPFWSPDSRQLAYLTQPGNFLTAVFDVATRTSRELCTCRFQRGSWGPTGVILLGTLDGSPIQRVSLTDRLPSAVTRAEATDGELDSLPIWLPDGQRFLFTRSRPGSAPVTYAASLDGGEPRRVADGSWDLIAQSGIDGGAYLLGLEAAGLVARSFDVSTLSVGTKSVVVVAGAGAASLSNNGLLVTSAPGASPITQPTWFDRRGRNLGGLGTPGEITGIGLARDGRTAAVRVQREGDFGLWLRDVDGGERRLTFGSGFRGDAPVWSPEGGRLVVSSRGFGGVSTMYARAVDGTGSETRVLETPRSAFANDWSPDGRWLLYTMPKPGGGADLDLWAVPMEDVTERKPVLYLGSPAREAQAEFSPDGRFVAYSSNENGDSVVYVQPFPNAADGKWLVSNGGGSEPHWSRDGKELFYIAGQTLMAVPVSTRPTFSIGTPERLFDAPVQPWYTNDSDRSQVGPDGRFLLLIAVGKNAAPPLNVVVNWPALLRPSNP